MWWINVPHVESSAAFVLLFSFVLFSVKSQPLFCLPNLLCSTLNLSLPRASHHLFAPIVLKQSSSIIRTTRKWEVSTLSWTQYKCSGEPTVHINDNTAASLCCIEIRSCKSEKLIKWKIVCGLVLFSVLHGTACMRGHARVCDDCTLFYHIWPHSQPVTPLYAHTERIRGALFHYFTLSVIPWRDRSHLNIFTIIVLISWSRTVILHISVACCFGLDVKREDSSSYLTWETVLL